MQRKYIIGIVAVSDDGKIANIDGGLPWDVPEDLRRFKQITLGHSIIMGRKTYAAIGKPLVGRQNIVVTRDHNANLRGVDVCSSIDDALLVAETQTIFIIGGAEIFAATENLLDELLLTRVHMVVGEGVALVLDLSKFDNVREARHTGFTYIHYKRKELAHTSKR